ncbi:hypothetical protein O1L68_00965 [Streptomyces lydicus]|nr:hypothetical protein [Streptomyces lydicus]
MTVLVGLHVSPEFPAMIERIDTLGGALEADADTAEKLGRLTEDIARALLDAGVVRAALPQSLGGHEFSTPIDRDGRAGQLPRCLGRLDDVGAAVDDRHHCGLSRWRCGGRPVP